MTHDSKGDDSMNGDEWKNIQQSLDGLPKEIAPKRDLWSGIRATIELHQAATDTHQEQPFDNSLLNPNQSDTIKQVKINWMPWAMAASLFIAVSSMTFSFKVWQDYQHFSEQQTALMEKQITLQLLDQQHRVMKANFLEDFASASQQLDPAVIADIEYSLSTIEQAIVDIRRAMKKQPNNEQLMNLLEQTYQREQQMLTQITRSYPTI